MASDFLELRLDQFGPYEDALSVRSRTVFHSLLTPLLNCGLLTPGEVVAQTLARHAERPVPINSLEGFLRQIVGWREFVYRVSDRYDADALPNELGHTRRLGEAWWTGDTGLPPLDLAIRRALGFGWLGHIERLMVVGAAMLMAEVHPAESYRWFMELFVDSADWVMLPNVVGMSQFADGGLIGTKPYLSSSAYLRRMGDYEPGPWTEVWDGLFWRFVERHRPLLEANPRLSPMVLNRDRLDDARYGRLAALAEEWIERVTVLQSDATEGR